MAEHDKFTLQKVALGLTLLSTGICYGQTNMKNNDLPIGNFKGADFGGWTQVGTAFGSAQVIADQVSKLGISNSHDYPVATSKTEGDEPKGNLTSPPFKITRKYVSFLISGGDYELHTCLNLIVNGNIVRRSTGRRSDQLTPASWDVTRFRGQQAQIQIVDQASGDWGHINVSNIVQTDLPERLPIVTEPLYKESLRPQFHFTARQWTMDRLNPREHQEGWVNDLNGLIYYDGEYHLFAQRWATCWLHAVSRDLVHWTELEPAFWEEELGSGVQSGTCIVDYHNTSGLSPDPAHPPLIAFWSRFDNRSQCLCYSLDHGRTWKHYAKNPFMIHAERDPKVFWYEPGKHWVMVLYGDGQYYVLTSRNLRDWKDEHKPIHDSFECPDFFELPLDGDKNRKKWVLIQGNGNYSIGTFDGVEFKEEVGRFPCDVGPHFYATQSWANVETGDGRRIQTAWMRGSDFPDMPFNQQISFPCELTLRMTIHGPRIFREPIAQISSLHTKHQTWGERTLASNEELTLAGTGQLFHIKADVTVPEGSTLTFLVHGVPVDFTAKTVANGSNPAPVIEHVKTVEILVDRTSIEVFVNHGEISSTRFVLPKQEGLSLKAEGGPVTIHSLTVYELKSAWPDHVVK